MRALTISPFNVVEEIDLPEDFDARYAAMRERLGGGFMERVKHPTRSDLVCWVNENGLNEGLWANPIATQAFYPYPDTPGLVGDVIVTGEGYVDTGEGYEDLDVVELPADITVTTFGGVQA